MILPVFPIMSFFGAGRCQAQPSPLMSHLIFVSSSVSAFWRVWSGCGKLLYLGFSVSCRDHLLIYKWILQLLHFSALDFPSGSLYFSDSANHSFTITVFPFGIVTVVGLSFSAVTSVLPQGWTTFTVLTLEHEKIYFSEYSWFMDTVHAALWRIWVLFNSSDKCWSLSFESRHLILLDSNYQTDLLCGQQLRPQIFCPWLKYVDFVSQTNEMFKIIQVFVIKIAHSWISLF